MRAAEYRSLIEAHIQAMIDLLDGIDDDPDFEIDPDIEDESDLDLAPISLQSVDRVRPKHVTMRRAA